MSIDIRALACEIHGESGTVIVMAVNDFSLVMTSGDNNIVSFLKDDDRISNIVRSLYQYVTSRHKMKKTIPGFVQCVDTPDGSHRWLIRMAVTKSDVEQGSVNLVQVVDTNTDITPVYYDDVNEALAQAAELMEQFVEGIAEVDWTQLNQKDMVIL